MARKRLVVQDDEGLVELFPTGCTLLDCVLGGGWPVGRYANIVGDFSSGKCARNAMVLTQTGFSKLDDLNFPLGKSKRSLDLALGPGTQVHASHSWREEVTTTIKLTTRAGFEIEGTSEHKILVWTKDGVYVMRRLVDITASDTPIITGVTNDVTSNPEVLGVHPDFLPEAASFFGLFVADGCFAGKNRASITNGREWFAKRIKDVCALLDLSVRARVDKNTVDWSFNKKVATWIRNLLDNPAVFTARFKYVPKFVLASRDYVQAAFLRSLIDCDSYQDSRHGDIHYDTASEQLAKTVQLMLLQFGIVTRRTFRDNVKGYEGHKYWDVTIPSGCVNTYLAEIGSDRFVALSRTPRTTSIPHLAVLIKQWIDDLRYKLNWSKNGKVADGRRFPRLKLSLYLQHDTGSYFLLNEFLEKFKGWGDLTQFEKIRDNGYFYDQVSSVEVCEYEEPVDVFDVHVPKGNRFWCNGFVNHNTLLAIEAVANFQFTFPNGSIRYFDVEAAFDKAYADSLGVSIDPDPDLDYIEELFKEVDKYTKEPHSEPALWVVDSFDALKTEKVKEGFDTEKSRMVSQLFRQCITPMRKAKLTLLIVSQVRDAIGVVFGRKQRRAGGKALDFYAVQIVWLSHVKQIKQTRKKVERIVGIEINADCRKNKMGAPFRKCNFPVYFGYGIDDLEANVDWLQEVGAISKKEADELYSNEDNTQASLMVREEWADIELRFKRKGKYTK